MSCLKFYRFGKKKKLFGVTVSIFVVKFLVLHVIFSEYVSLSLDQQSEVQYSLFFLYIQVEDYRNILRLRCWPIAFSSYKPF